MYHLRDMPPLYQKKCTHSERDITPPYWKEYTITLFGEFVTSEKYITTRSKRTTTHSKRYFATLSKRNTYSTPYPKNTPPSYLKYMPPPYRKILQQPFREICPHTISGNTTLLHLRNMPPPHQKRHNINSILTTLFFQTPKRTKNSYIFLLRIVQPPGGGIFMLIPCHLCITPFPIPRLHTLV